MSQPVLEPDLHLCCHFLTCRLLGKECQTQAQARCVLWDNVKCSDLHQVFAKQHRRAFTLQRTTNAELKSLDSLDLVYPKNIFKTRKSAWDQLWITPPRDFCAINTILLHAMASVRRWEARPGSVHWSYMCTIQVVPASHLWTLLKTKNVKERMCSKTSFVYTSCIAVINQIEDIMMRYLTPTTKIIDTLSELVIHVAFTKIPWEYLPLFWRGKYMWLI